MKFVKNPLLKRVGRDAYRLNFIVSISGLIVLNMPMVDMGALDLVFSYAATVCILIFGAMRCHDIGRSGWMQFIPGYHLYLLFAEGESAPTNLGQLQMMNFPGLNLSDKLNA